MNLTTKSLRSYISCIVVTLQPHFLRFLPRLASPPIAALWNSRAYPWLGRPLRPRGVRRGGDTAQRRQDGARARSPCLPPLPAHVEAPLVDLITLSLSISLSLRLYCTLGHGKITNVGTFSLRYEPRFIRIKKAEVTKRQYSSKAKGSNVREGG